VQGLLHLLLVGLDALAEGQVVGQEGQVASQVSGVVEGADDLGGDG
jgi:hypothetical protein